MWTNRGASMNGDELQLEYVLRQKTIPVAIRFGTGHKLVVKLPYAAGNMVWLQNGRRARPHWLADNQRWEIPNSWFNDFVNRSLGRYGKVYIIQPHREQEKCAPACMTAEGHECECSCLGANHGTGFPRGWFIASDAFACRWGPRRLACRLLQRSAAQISSPYAT